MIYFFCKVAFLKSICVLSLLFSQEMQVKYVIEFSWDMKLLGEVTTEREQYIAPGFFKKNSKIYPESWVLRRMFNKDNGEIMIAGGKNILKYDNKEEVYWLITIDEYFKKSEKDTIVNRSSERDLFFSDVFEEFFNNSDENFSIQRENTSQVENINGFRAKKWNTTIQNSRQKLFFEEWLVKELPLKDTLDSLKIDLMEKFNPNPHQNSNTSFILSSDIFVQIADSTVILDPLDGKIVQAKMYCEHEFLKSISFEIKELYTSSFDASSFTIPEKYNHINKDD